MSSHPALTAPARTLLLALSLTAAVVLGGCGLSVADTPLGASADQRGVQVGTPVTGRVENPDGDITVSLSRAEDPQPEPGSNGPGPRCDYDSDAATFSCATTALRPGLYRVEVTDAAYASEGTKLVTVAVTEDAGYAPEITVVGGGTRDPGSVDGPLGFSDDQRRATLLLTGWEPGRTVTVRLVSDRAGTDVRRRQVVPDAEGRARLRVGPLPAGTYSLLGSDGLWSDGRAEGWNRSVLLVGSP